VDHNVITLSKKKSSGTAGVGRTVNFQKSQNPERKALRAARQALPAPQIGIEAGLAPSSTPAAQRSAQEEAACSAIVIGKTRSGKHCLRRRLESRRALPPRAPPLLRDLHRGKPPFLRS